MTPPRQASRRIAGLVAPLMLSRRVYLWHSAPPFPETIASFTTSRHDVTLAKVCMYIRRGGGVEEEEKRRRGRGGGGNHSPHTLESLFLSHDIITFTNIGYCMRLVAMALE